MLTAEAFDTLAGTNPGLLFALIRSGELPEDMRALAVRAFGGAHDSVCVGPLLGLLSDPSEAVREGAVLGLRSHARLENDNYRTREALTALRNTDSSDRVRAAVTVALGERVAGAGEAVGTR